MSQGDVDPRENQSPDAPGAEPPAPEAPPSAPSSGPEAGGRGDDGPFASSSEDPARSPRNESRPGSAPPGGDAAAEDAEALAALDLDSYRQMKARAEERDLYLDELLRAKADLENYRKRVQRERPNWESFAVRQLLQAILPVLDNFERAISVSRETETDLESFRRGVQMIDELLCRTLEDFGVEEIPALGETFDPEVHEALSEVVVDDRPTGEIVDVEQKGYVYRGVVVRPSKVHVARNKSSDGR
ncbi:MAG: nucleotide exchange factor GrpE [Planctomycetes bacterium]|nr:nucleotide exchange factor GrpE [Planctomycetota bacterium]